MNTTQASKLLNSIDGNNEVNSNYLFMDYKSTHLDSKRRSLSTMDYEGLKQLKIQALTKSPRNFQ